MCAKRDSRIRTVHIENGGVSNARNVGLDTANGEYIMFLDCDDYISADTVEKLYSIFDNETDMVQCSYKIVDDAGSALSIYPTKNEVYEGTVSILSAFFDIQILQSSCAKLYRAELLKDIRFNTKFAVGEDDYFSFCVCNKARKVKTIDEPLYNYYENQDSVMRERISEKHFQILEILDIELEKSRYNKALYEHCAVKDINISNILLYRIFRDETMLDRFYELKDRISAHKSVVFFSKRFSLRERCVYALLIYAPWLYLRLKKGKLK